MKKLLIIKGLLLFSIAASYGCDICGCGVNNYNPFLFPHLNKRFIGLTYLHRGFRISTNDGMHSREEYNSLLMSAQLSITKKLQLAATLPYHLNTLTNEYGNTSINGIGDASLLVYYKLLDKTITGKKHTLLLGAGVKLPTGKYTPVKSAELDDQNFQLGSGSVDYIVNAAYTFTRNNWLLGAGASYKYNTQSNAGFRFGDVATTSAIGAYTIAGNKFSVMPYLQLRDEVQLLNAADHELQDHTGGNVLYTTPGIDLTTAHFTIGAAYQLAAVQHLAEYQVKVKPSFSAHISFTF